MVSKAKQFYTILIVLSVLIHYNISVEVIFERAKIEHFNRSYVVWANGFVSRFGRHSPYYVNLEGEIIHPWGYNISIDIVFYEYLSNEFRRSFVEMHTNVCKAMKHDKYIGGMMRSVGLNVCPVPQGQYRLLNVSVPSGALTDVWPFKRARLNITVVDNVKKVVIGKGYVQAAFSDGKKQSKG